jgi:hypothetical protein
MTDPIHTWHDYEIQAIRWKERFWSVIITALIVCVITYILTDAKYMNKPVIMYVSEPINMTQPYATNYLVPSTSEFLSKGNPVELTPVKEGK